MALAMIITFAAQAAVVMYFTLKIPTTLTRKELAKLCLFGFMSIFPIAIIEYPLKLVIQKYLFYLLAVPAIEEPMKYAAFVFSTKGRENSANDTFVGIVTAALGYAIAECVFPTILGTLTPAGAALRVMFSTPVHVAEARILAVTLNRATDKPHIALTFVLPMTIHGFFDLTVMTHNIGAMLVITTTAYALGIKAWMSIDKQALSENENNEKLSLAQTDNQ